MPIGIFSINANKWLRCLQKHEALHRVLEILFSCFVFKVLTWYHILLTKVSTSLPTKRAKQDYTESYISLVQSSCDQLRKASAVISCSVYHLIHEVKNNLSRK